MSAPFNENEMGMKRVAEDEPAGAKAQAILGGESARLKSCPDTVPPAEGLFQQSIKSRQDAVPSEASLQEAATSCSHGSCTCGNGGGEVKAAEKGLTLAQVRQELKGVKGKRFWRSIDELAGTPEFEEALKQEFPAAAQEWVDPVSRRGFMKLMGASMALAGLAGCTKQPDEPIYPYVKAPEDLILGKPNFFATAYPFLTGGIPTLVKSDEFRPIKVDGNPEHKYNQGGSDVFTQGSLLDLYDPDRSSKVLYRGEERGFEEFIAAFRDAAGASKDGTGIYFLSATITSPTLARQWSEVEKAYPKAKLVQYDPAIAGTAFAQGVTPQYALAGADVIVSLDADFLSGAAYPGFHRLVRDYAGRRKTPANLNRLYAIESSPTTTGFKSEHRLPLRASEVPAFTAALAQAIGVSGVSAPSYAWTDEQQKYLAAVAKDLKENAGKSVVIPGLYHDPAVTALALAINQTTGQRGQDGADWRSAAQSASQRPVRRAQGAGGGSECGQGGLADHPEFEPDLQRASRSGFSGCVQ